MLMPVSPAAAAGNIDAFRQGLRDRGWVGGQNITVETRHAERAEWLPDLAAELVQLKVDIIVTWGTPAARAAKKATSTTIVMAAAIDPVETGLVSSLARPGGNLTGLSSGGSELSGKALELLREIVPSVARMAVVWNPDNPAEKVKVKEAQATAQPLGVSLQSLEARTPNEIECLRGDEKRTSRCSPRATRAGILDSQQTHRRTRGKEPAAGNVREKGVCGRWRPHVLWRELS